MCETESRRADRAIGNEGDQRRVCPMSKAPCRRPGRYWRRQHRSSGCHEKGSHRVEVCLLSPLLFFSLWLSTQRVKTTKHRTASQRDRWKCQRFLVTFQYSRWEQHQRLRADVHVDLQPGAKRSSGSSVAEGRTMGQKAVRRFRVIGENTGGRRNGTDRSRGGSKDANVWNASDRLRSVAHAPGRRSDWRWEILAGRDMANSRLHHRAHAAYSSDEKYCVLLLSYSYIVYYSSAFQLIVAIISTPTTTASKKFTNWCSLA